MEKYLNSLSKTILFKGIELNELKDIINNILYTIVDYKKNQVIAIEDDDCNSLGIILEGDLEIHKSFPSGKIVTISNFQSGNVFGEALIFSGVHKYPATIIATSDSKIMYIHRDTIISLMTKYQYVLSNFVSVLSNRILMLNHRVINLSYDTVRKKIANLILTEYKKQNNNIIKIPFDRKKMSEMLNIPRPSLSRELVKMKEEGIIDFNKNQFEILDLDLLEESLF